MVSLSETVESILDIYILEIFLCELGQECDIQSVKN